MKRNTIFDFLFFFCRAKSGDRYHSQWRDVDLFMCPLEIFARSLGHFCQWPINGQWTTFSRESTSIQWRSFSFRSRTRCSRWAIFFCWILSWPIDQIELLDTVFDRSWNQPSNEQLSANVRGFSGLVGFLPWNSWIYPSQRLDTLHWMHRFRQPQSWSRHHLEQQQAVIIVKCFRQSFAAPQLFLNFFSISFYERKLCFNKWSKSFRLQ